MDRSSAFARVAPLLRGRRVVRYDRRGYGRSQLDPGQPGLDVAGHAADLLAVIDEHAAGRAVVVGHSLGGVVALAAAAARPHAVAAVGAYEAPMPWRPWWPDDSAGDAAVSAADEHSDELGAERFLRRMIGDDRWASLGEAQQAVRRAEGTALIAELRSTRRVGEPPYDLDAVRSPVRSACGSLAKPYHRRAAQLLAEAVGQDGGVDVLDGAGHGAHLSHPESFAAWADAVASST